MKTGESLLTLRGEEQRIGYANIEKIAPTATIKRGTRVSPLGGHLRDFSRFTYTHKGRRLTLDDFMSQLNVVGLLAIRDGGVALERYARGHTAAARWTSFSVAKSVTSLLYGAAVRDGSIRTLDAEIPSVVPELAGTSYDGVTLRHLLQMASGVAWSEQPSDPESNVRQMARLSGFPAQLAYMGKLARHAPPGTRFNYNTAETDLAGHVLRRAIGKGLAQYLSEKIWQPYGMESDGFWITMRGGDLERGGCCISATLRDYGRIGLFALADGVTPDGTHVLPDGWMRESTRPSAGSKGYGYYWWLRPNGRYFASGSFGQHIEVAPADRVVVAIQSYWPEAFNDELIAHNDTVVAAIIEFLGRK